MSATHGKIEYRYWVDHNKSKLYAYKVVAELRLGLVRLRALDGAEFHSAGSDDFKRTKKEAWEAAMYRTELDLAQCTKEYKEYKAILKRLGMLERRLKRQQEKANEDHSKRNQKARSLRRRLGKALAQPG